MREMALITDTTRPRPPAGRRSLLDAAHAPGRKPRPPMVSSAGTATAIWTARDSNRARAR